MCCPSKDSVPVRDAQYVQSLRAVQQSCPQHRPDLPSSLIHTPPHTCSSQQQQRRARGGGDRSQLPITMCHRTPQPVIYIGSMHAVTAVCTLWARGPHSLPLWSKLNATAESTRETNIITMCRHCMCSRSPGRSLSFVLPLTRSPLSHSLTVSLALAVSLSLSLIGCSLSPTRWVPLSVPVRDCKQSNETQRRRLSDHHTPPHPSVSWHAPTATHDFGMQQSVIERESTRTHALLQPAWLRATASCVHVAFML